MSVLNEARENFGFKNVWTYDGWILYKYNNDGQKIKIYYELKLYWGADGYHKNWKKLGYTFFVV